MGASSESSRLESLTEDIYPNLFELTEWMHATGENIPPPLTYLLLERYAEHASEYPSTNEHLDLDTGRKRYDNACLTRNSFQDAIEEIVDAIFNIVIAEHKGSNTGSILRLLIEAWRLCHAAKNK